MSGAALYDLVVIGEGIAGLACAGHAAARGLGVATLEANLFGGLVVNIPALEGCPEPVSGIDLASRLAESNAGLGVTSVNATATAITGSHGDFRVATDVGEHRTRAVVIASGAQFRRLNVAGEAEFAQRGVSHCATCDGPLFQREPVVVVGGGDAAFSEAATLARYASTVTILLRGESPRARPEFVAPVLASPNVTIVRRAVVEAILGGEQVECVQIRHEGTMRDIACAGVFVFAGLVPNTEYAPPSLARTADGHVVTSASLETSLSGAYAIGAVRQGYSGRLVDAVAEARAVAEQVVASLGQ